MCNLRNNRKSNFKIRRARSERPLWNYENDYSLDMYGTRFNNYLIVSKNVFWELILSENVCSALHKFWNITRNIVKESIKVRVIDVKSRGNPAIGIQLQKGQIRHLGLGTTWSRADYVTNTRGEPITMEKFITDTIMLFIIKTSVEYQVSFSAWEWYHHTWK